MGLLSYEVGELVFGVGGLEFFWGGWEINLIDDELQDIYFFDYNPILDCSFSA